MPNGSEPPHVYAKEAADRAFEEARESSRELFELHLDIEWIKGVLASKDLATVAELTRPRPAPKVLLPWPSDQASAAPGASFSGSPKFGVNERVIVRQGGAQGTVVSVSRSVYPRADGATAHYQVSIPGLGQFTLREDELEAIQCEETDEEEETS